MLVAKHVREAVGCDLLSWSTCRALSTMATITTAHVSVHVHMVRVPRLSTHMGTCEWMCKVYIHVTSRVRM